MERLAWDRQAPVWQEEELESTSLRLRELAEAGAEGGTVLLADRQTGGRGRQGRSFLSPEGGLYLSALLRPDCAAEHCTELTALAAVAVQRAVKAVTGVSAGIKWPNDLLLGEKKLCGILTELCMDKEGRPQVILGIGLNLNTPPEAFSGELSHIACSLFGETGQQTDRQLMLERLLSELDGMFARWEREGCFFLEEYRQLSLCRGRDVWVLAGGESRKAYALDINPDLSLQLRWADGREEALFYGELSLRLR